MKLANKRKPRRGLTRGYFFWKRRWYSICGVHYDHNPHCRMCITGRWGNVWLGAMGHVVFKLCPSVWRWWANLPIGSGGGFFEKLNKLK